MLLAVNNTNMVTHCGMRLGRSLRNALKHVFEYKVGQDIEAQLKGIINPHVRNKRRDELMSRDGIVRDARVRAACHALTLADDEL